MNQQRKHECRKRRENVILNSSLNRTTHDFGIVNGQSEYHNEQQRHRAEKRQRQKNSNHNRSLKFPAAWDRYTENVS
jgi:hypothetical protein